ncbi:sigma-54-dependent transcriptional regulator [Desulfosediminicola flagellatus]|uniref:sigma-54-dependent transcriptional regulator n=1 Tax=Desulfosediminicola flagellatus TaxID=2569541 RepID=UPI0010ABFABE|nr:sigma-54 dependent transcriptional regulator [Desulfosediminicola flagellatus]
MTGTLNPYDPILVIDDEEAILLSVDTILNMAGMNNVITCADSRQAMAIIEQRKPSVVLLDLNMPHVKGEIIIEKLSELYPSIPVIIITGRIDAETAVHCMKSGASDYIVKPVDEERLLSAVKKSLQSGQVTIQNTLQECDNITERLDHPDAFKTIVTRSLKMVEIFQYIESIATTDQPVLVRGETGTGKELIAHVIHNLSQRSGEFVAVNVAGLDDNVFSDTLFGHVKGAFTGAEADRRGLLERANGGTIFLDEIGDLTQASQVKLLRLLQENEYMPLGQDNVRTSSARVIASTHVDLWDIQRKKLFRKDLHYRIRTHRIHAPPLRERKEDLGLLSAHFLQLAATALNKSIPKMPAELITLLETYNFPGNIRELQAMIFDAMAQNKNGILSLMVFREHMARMRKLDMAENTVNFNTSPSFTQSDVLPSIKQATRMLIKEAMTRANNNQSIAASLLGISQQALSKRLKNFSEEK